jgi:hypothetical protein
MADSSASVPSGNLPALPRQVSGKNIPHGYVEFVMSKCKECNEFGPWTQTVRVGDRITEYNSWDVEHNKATKHREFYHLTLTRSDAQIFLL